MSDARAGGPLSTSRAEAMAVLSPGLVASLCLEAADGSLRALPVRVVQATLDVVGLSAAAGANLEAGPACLVADEFASYVGIRGAIVRGALSVVAADGRADLTVTHARGFSFENTTTSL